MEEHRRHVSCLLAPSKELRGTNWRDQLILIFCRQHARLERSGRGLMRTLDAGQDKYAWDGTGLPRLERFFE